MSLSSTGVTYNQKDRERKIKTLFPFFSERHKSKLNFNVIIKEGLGIWFFSDSNSLVEE